jgi:hypothetical protein
LIRVWSEFGPSLVRVWSEFGPSLVRVWSEFGPSLIRVWSKAGADLSRRRGNTLLSELILSAKGWFWKGLYVPVCRCRLPFFDVGCGHATLGPCPIKIFLADNQYFTIFNYGIAFPGLPVAIIFLPLHSASEEGDGSEELENEEKRLGR